jgi:hypothetical protein
VVVQKKDSIPGKTTAFSKLRQPTSVATFASVAVRCLFASFAPAQFLRDLCVLCVLCGETPGFPVTTCVLADEFAFPITGSPDESALPFRERRSRCDHVAITAIPQGCRGISTVLLKANDFSQIDPCVTPRFPLGHPDFSTGSPKLLLGSRKPSLLFPDQPRVSLCSAALWLNADGCLLSASFQIPSRLSAWEVAFA